MSCGGREICGIFPPSGDNINIRSAAAIGYKAKGDEVRISGFAAN
jgi:hypothetical protein